jgi:hypothetical protein
MSGVSRHPSPASGRSSHRGRAFVAAAAVIALSVGSGSARPAAAADDGSSVLDGTFVDVAFVGGGPGRTPDLLTLDVTLDPSVSTVSLLRRTTGWTSVAAATVPLTPVSDGSSPWLVQLGPDRFGVLSVGGDMTTSLIPITVDATAEPPLRMLAPVEFALQATDAGVADVDADGSPELILLGYQGSFDDPCLTSAIAVVPLADLSAVGTEVQPLKPAGSAVITRTAGASPGEWDGKPGVDLLVHAYEGCLNGPDAVEVHHLLAIRLADLSTIVDRPTSEAEAATDTPWGFPPVVVDVDGDGRDEAIIASDAGFKLVDPVRRWAVTPFGRSSSALMTATPTATGGASVVWMHRNEDPASTWIVTARLVRSGDSIRVEEGDPRPMPDASAFELDSAYFRLQSAMFAQQRPVFLADADGDGCEDIVAPIVNIACDGTGAIRRGPSWIGSRPLALVGDPGDRSLLVAYGQDWYPNVGAPFPPTPLASQSLASWRVNTSTRFSLAEVPIDAAGVVDVGTVEPPTIDHLASTDGIVQIRWKQGTSLLVRVKPVGAAQTALNAEALRTPAGFLYDENQDGEYAGGLSMFGLPSPVGGDGTRLQDFDLRNMVTTPEGGLAERWTLTVAALSPTGALSQPVQGTAILDEVAPPLEMKTPTLTPPWPFAAGLEGTSEAGASVSMPGGPAVTVGPSGTFELPAQLAPWPQKLVVTAVDLAGNKTTKELSVMGGVDIRGLPWPAILVGLLLVGVALSSIRGVRGTRPSVAVRQYNDEVTPEIEELPVRPGRPTD